MDEIVGWGWSAAYDAAHFGLGFEGDGRVELDGWSVVLPEGVADVVADGAADDLATAVAEVPVPEPGEGTSVAEAVRPLLPLSGELVRGAKGDGNG